MAENKMFCFQCQETAKGTGCTIKGVCGKEATTSKWQDLLLSVVRGIGTIQHSIGEEPTPEVTHFLTDALFTTITNANFNDQDILQKVDKGIVLKKQLLQKAASMNIHLPAYQEVTWGGEKTDYEAEGARESVLRHENPDIRSLKELTMLGLKGMAAYYEHAAHLGEENCEIISFICRALATISNPDADMNTLLGVVLETGKYGVDVMALLDKANTQAYGNPELTRVNIGTGSNPGILISGHDLKDIEDLLIQTEGTGIDVYTHGEMLPAHYYPQLKKYKHLVGNYGNAWWKQKEEFESFNGPVVFTTNCIVPPSPSAGYRNRVFTTNSTGFPGWKHIQAGSDGHKDFSEVIALAKTCQPPREIETGEIIGGFAHAQVFALADKIVEAVKSGAIRKFVVMSGCDGRMKSRNYYEEFAKALPQDVVILTSGCAKFKYNKLNLGDINGIPPCAGCRSVQRLLFLGGCGIEAEGDLWSQRHQRTSYLLQYCLVRAEGSHRTSCPAASGRKEHPSGSYAPSLLFTSRTEGSGRYLWHCRKRNGRRGHQKIYRIRTAATELRENL